MRVGIIALLHESNTFIRQPTTIHHFRGNLLLTGAAIREALADSHHELGGMFAGLASAGIEAVPLLAARAIPYGTISAAAFDMLLEMMFGELERAGTLDGVLVAPHGATVSEWYPDADGHWLYALRERVGSEMPIIGTLDAHANLSQQMVDTTQALIAYRTNPHLDQRERGLEAAKLMADTLEGKIRPVQAAAFPPMAINIERQNTSEPHCRPLFERANSMLHEPGILSNSILLGFPYADVPEMGSSVIVVADGDDSRAQRGAHQLARELWNQRQDFAGHFLDVKMAVARCRDLDGPVCLLDMGDNVGGGSPADGTILAHELRQQNVGPALVCIYDPAAVEQARQAGAGSTVRLQVGGRSDALHGPPFEADFFVLRFHDGRFTEPEPRHGGFTHFEQGLTAVLQAGDSLTLLVNSARTPPFSLRQLTSCGLEPTNFRVIVAKGVHAPVAAYAPICRHLLRVNTPGVTCADMTQLHFTRRRQPMFPFEADTEWTD